MTWLYWYNALAKPPWTPAPHPQPDLDGTLPGRHRQLRVRLCPAFWQKLGRKVAFPFAVNLAAARNWFSGPQQTTWPFSLLLLDASELPAVPQSKCAVTAQHTTAATGV
jgi:hypothetical protein